MNHALKSVNKILTLFTALLMVCLLGISFYALWDNNQVYAEAENVQLELYKLKPVVDEETGEIDFSQLKAINPDVVGWITLDGTAIDYPIVQGETNMTYMNTDFYGSYSLAGSIFLDARSAEDLSDPYSLIYGHHMDKHLMFGDLELYKDKEFFSQYRNAVIITEDGVIEFKIYAVMDIPDSVMEIFDPSRWTGDLHDLLGYIDENAMYIWDPEKGDPGDDPEMIKIIALVTCASGHTGVRTVVFLMARTKPSPSPTPSPTPTPRPDPKPTPKPPDTGDGVMGSPLFWFMVVAAAAAAFVVLCIVDRKTKAAKPVPVDQDNWEDLL